MRRILLLLTAVFLCTASFAQETERLKKVSLETRRYLSSKGKVRSEDGSKKLRTVALDTDSMNAFIYVSDPSAVKELESLGVKIRYDYGTFLMGKIPLKNFDKIVDLESVRFIDKGSKKEINTDSMRIVTQAKDVLYNTTAAQSLGLKTSYTGKGVLVAVSDIGIDFYHKAFKTKDGELRIKKIFRNGEEVPVSSIIDGTLQNDTSEDHGTHTTSIAAGSNVKEVDGKIQVLSVDDTTALFGGMAPEADIFLSESLDDNALSTGFIEAAKYSKEHNMPCVFNCSWGSSLGAHVGGETTSTALANALKENNPNMVVIKSAGNSGGTVSHAVKRIESSDDVIRLALSGYTLKKMQDYDVYLYAAYVIPHELDVPLKAKLYVFDTTSVTNTPLLVADSITLENGISLSDSAKIRELTGMDAYVGIGYNDFVDRYFCKVYIIRDSLTDAWKGTQKHFALEVSSLNGEKDFTFEAWNMNCSFYPVDKIKDIDFTEGDNLCSLNSDSFDDNVINIGSYVSRTIAEDKYNGVRDTVTRKVQGNVVLSPALSGNGDYLVNEGEKTYIPTKGDISIFSSFSIGNDRPAGPFISAPGEKIYSAVNHSSKGYTYRDTSEYKKGYVRVNQDMENPYGSMQGTSMSAPCVTGIVALWMDCAQRNNITLNADSVRNIMAATCDYDDFTGPEGSTYIQFGTHGKINALKGIAYILNLAASTGIDNISDADTSVENVEHIRYVNMSGIESNVPHKGVNLVVTRYKDGHESVKKQVFD